MKEVKLQSGATLGIGQTPFAESKALFQALMDEAKGIGFNSMTDQAALVKDLFCYTVSSKRVEAALWECLKRCTYNGLKIENATFEPEEARADFIDICMQVAEENLRPFMKGLYAKLNQTIAMIQNIHA